MRQKYSWEVLLERKQSVLEHNHNESDSSMTSTVASLGVEGSSSDQGENGRSHVAGQDEETAEEVRQLREIKASYEEQLGLCAERSARFKETILELRDTNHNLKRQLEDLKRNNHGAVVKDLEEEISKWETLYAETAEVGAARMKRLEDELEQLRRSSMASESATIESMEQIESVCNALGKTIDEMQRKEREFEDYKRKSTERITMLKDRLEYANAEKEKELDNLKRKQAHEYALMEKIEDLQVEVQAKAAIIERERNQATKREARLREQIRKLEYKDPRPQGEKSRRPQNLDLLDSACTSFATALDGTLNWCAPKAMDLVSGKKSRTSSAPEVATASE